MRSTVPGVKYTTEGRPGWTPIRVKRQKSAAQAADVSDNSSDKEYMYDVAFLDKCKEVKLCRGKKGRSARVWFGSIRFNTPISARTRSRVGTSRPQ